MRSVLLLLLLLLAACHLQQASAATTPDFTDPATSTEEAATPESTAEPPTTDDEATGPPPTTDEEATGPPTTDDGETSAPTTRGEEASNDTTIESSRPTSEAPTSSTPTRETPGPRTTRAETGPTPTRETPGPGPRTTRAETGSPTTLEEGTRSPTTQEEGTRPPTTQKEGTRPPTTQEEGTRPPTTQEEGTRPPTTRDEGTRPPTTREEGTRPPTTEERTQTPTTETPTTQPPTLQPPETYEIGTPYGTVIGSTYTVVRGFAFDAKRPTGPRRLSRFLGVPYAQPPVGARRFRPPVKLQNSSDEVINATAFKPNCPQLPLRSAAEDCLYFNIWTPRTAENPNATYPVIVWIHGGRFEVGGSDDGLTEGEELVTHEDAVVVTFNYRLGALGFMTLNGTDFGGNYGIRDQKLALEVIHEVVGEFGGDVSKITLMGLDAGSASIGFHMLHPRTKNLFGRAIMMGGSPMMPWPLTPVTSFVQQLSEQFVHSLNCSHLGGEQQRRCLQEVDLGALLNAQRDLNQVFRGLEFLPIIDGDVVPEDPWSAFSNGRFDDKDLLLGATNEEGANMAANALEARRVEIDALNDEALLDMVQRLFDWYPRTGQLLTPAGFQFLQLHFTNRGGNNNGRANFKILSDTVGDWLLACSVPQMARFADRRLSNVYMYYFTEKEIMQNLWEGASHGEDAKYAFGIPTSDRGIIYPPGKKSLSERIMGYFVRFANTGVPVTDPILWKPLNSSGSEMNFINFNADARILGNQQFGFRQPQCHFWNRTLAFVNGLQEIPPTTPPTPSPTTTASTTTTEETTSEELATSTTRPPIGPSADCSWAFTETSGLILGILLVAQLATAAALVYFVIKWKNLAKVGDSGEAAVPMTRQN